MCPKNNVLSTKVGHKAPNRVNIHRWAQALTTEYKKFPRHMCGPIPTML